MKSALKLSATNPLSAAVSQRWQNMTPRDQRALSLLASVLTITLLYLLVWQPVQLRLDQARLWQQNQYELSQHLAQNAHAIAQRTISSGVAITAEQLQSVATSTAQEAGLIIERYDSTGSGLNLSLSNAPFSTLLHWLQQLERRGVSLSEASISRSGSGLVSAQLSLQVAGL